MSAMSPVLDVRGLTVSYRQGRAWRPAVSEVSLQVSPGEALGLVGESGSGKSTLALAVMGALPPDARVEQGDIRLAGRSLCSLPAPEQRAVWAHELALVPQDAAAALNPSMRLGEQVAEALSAAQGLGRAAAAAGALALLSQVGLAEPARVARSYAHQVSGGMQQRVLIAVALSGNPRLLVLDEPTTGLDVTTQSAILDLLRGLLRERGTAALYVSHDLDVVASLCQRVSVLYAGELVESGPVQALFSQPLHPYTQGLVASRPVLGARQKGRPLAALPGQVPGLAERPAACVYAPRCPLAVDQCGRERPALDVLSAERHVRCHRWREIAAGEVSTLAAPAAPAMILETGPRPAPGGAPLLEIDALCVHFPLPRPVSAVVLGQPAGAVRAVDGVSLRLAPGETLGLVGESGSGKTTLARAVMGLAEPTAGAITLLGGVLPPRLGQRGRSLLRRLQLVAQNPYEALNPYLTVGETLSRPLQTLRGLNRRAAAAEVARLLAAVRLPPAYAGRRPGQLSGGERQRVALARAFAAEPALLVADEPVSALDVSVQAAVLNLLKQLQQETGNGLLLISHDLAVVSHMADVVGVLFAGRLMALARTEDLMRPPYHPYTEALLKAARCQWSGQSSGATRQWPNEDASGRQAGQPVGAAPEAGCPYQARCPHFLGELCANTAPPWRTTPGGGHYLCHIPPDELAAAQQPLVSE